MSKKGTYHYYEQLFTHDEVNQFQRDGAFIDGRNGGLVLGPSHSEGGIYFLFEYPEGFRLFGELEGLEYILSRERNRSGLERMSGINNRKRDIDAYNSSWQIPDGITILDARSESEFYQAKYMLLDVRGGFAIVNKYSTQKFIRKLETINNPLYF
jgi:hypothetical protein